MSPTHHALQDLAKACVCSVQPGARHYCDVELGAIGVWASIGHAHPPRTIVLQNEVLVFEGVAINAVSSSAIEVGEVTS